MTDDRQEELLDFLVNGHLLEDGVELLQFQALRGILLVLHRDITAGAGHAAVLVLGALEDHLNPVAFALLCHGIGIFSMIKQELYRYATVAQFFYHCIQTLLIDGADSVG